MTPAEFKCMRESLGLSAKWLSERWGVALLSVQRWEKDRALPGELEEDLLSIVDKAAETVAIGVEREDGSIEVPRTDACSLDGFPAAYHRAVAWEIARHTGAEIVYRAE